MSEDDNLFSVKRKWQKWWIWVVVFLLFSIFLAIYAYTKGAQKVEYHYITKEVYRGDLNLTVSATGYLYPLGSVDVGSEVSGTIAEVKADFNDRVQKGDVLARIDQTKYQSSLKRAEAILKSAKAMLKSSEADMRLKKSNYQRNIKLKKSSRGGLPSQKEWDTTYTAYLFSKASYESAKAKVQEAKFAYDATLYDLEHTIIYAPISGIVLKRNIDPGQTVVASFQAPVLFTLADDLKEMELQVSIDEADIAKIKVAQKAFFSVEAYLDEYFKAYVKSIRVNSEMVAGVVTYKALLAVNNHKLKLLPGMSADANIVISSIKEAWIVPRAALLYVPVMSKERFSFGAQNTQKLDIDPKSHVWVERNGKALKIYVDILGTNGTQVAVNAKDLQAGDRVILSQEKNL